MLLDEKRKMRYNITNQEAEGREEENMEQIELQTQKREVLGKKVKNLRREGLIPAVLYGHDIESLPLQIEERELNRVLTQAGGHRLIALKIGRAKNPQMALAREVQWDVITSRPLHVDFYAVVMTEKITTAVPLTLVGEAPAADQAGVILLQGLDEIEIECLPGDLIEAIEVDLSALKEMDQAIYVKDLRVSPAVEILTDPEELVAKVAWAAPEEVEEEVVPVAPAEVEVITKGKKEEAEEE
ncbi:MAG: 50S ribosomal protein L25 [Chloroflexi bacterium]|nr:50S ribosomal protein L25 [Chloroflexota bacterium]